MIGSVHGQLASPESRTTGRALISCFLESEPQLAYLGNVECMKRPTCSGTEKNYQGTNRPTTGKRITGNGQARSRSRRTLVPGGPDTVVHLRRLAFRDTGR